MYKQEFYFQVQYVCLFYKNLVYCHAPSHSIMENNYKIHHTHRPDLMNLSQEDLIKRIIDLEIINEDLRTRRDDLERLNDELTLTEASIEFASEQMFWIDEQGYILRANRAACKELGYTPEELNKMHVSQINPNEYLQGEQWTENWKIFLEKKFNAYESIHLTKDDKVIPIEIHTNLLNHKDKAYCFAYARDISKRKSDELVLTKYRENLEEQVGKRTSELAKVNERLKFTNEQLTINNQLLYIKIEELKKLKDALSYAQNRLMEAQKLANLGSWTYLIEGQKMEWSPEIFEQFGIEPLKERFFSFQEFLDWVHPEDHEHVRNNYKKVLKEKFAEYDLRIVRKDGQIRHIRSRTQILTNTEGRVIGLFGINQDMTSQKQKDLQLRLAQYTINKAPIMIEWIEEDGTYFYANELSAVYSDFTKEELINKKIFEIDPNFDEESWKLNFQNIANQKALENFETIHRRKKGKEFPILVNAIHLEFEEKKYLCTYVTDISKLKGTEEILQETIEELKASEEEIRQNAEELLATNDNLEEAKALLEKSLENEKNANEKIEKRSKELYTQKRELRKTLSELKHTQDRLIQSEKMASLGVLVAGIAHEINNPVNYISTSSEALKVILEDVLFIIQHYEAIKAENVNEKLQEIQKLKEALEFDEIIYSFNELIDNIKAGAEQTAEIVRGLRNFSRMDGGELEQIDLHQSMDTALIMLHNQYKENIEIIKEYGDIPRIKCYPSKIQQVFMNMFINAIQAIQSKKQKGKGQIKITTYLSEKHNHKVVIEIEDNGVGISEEIRNRIFEPFFTNKDVGQGTGLGLSITLGIVESHQGTIAVESVEGKSTKFIITLPIDLEK